MTADDDDPVLPNMVEVHDKFWSQLELQSDYGDFWEVRTRCMTPEGVLVGAPLPEPYFDSDYIKVNIRKGNKAEMNGSRKLEILKNVAGVPPFIFEDKCSNFPEKLRWIRTAKLYKTRFVPDITRIYTPNPAGLIMNSKSMRSKYNTLVGATYMIRENRDILIGTSIKDYLREIVIIGYKSAETHERIKQIGFGFIDYILAVTAKGIFKTYFAIKQ